MPRAFRLNCQRTCPRRHEDGAPGRMCTKSHAGSSFQGHPPAHQYQRRNYMPNPSFVKSSLIAEHISSKNTIPNWPISTIDLMD
jgi:hypothetical protein